MRPVTRPLDTPSPERGQVVADRPLRSRLRRQADSRKRRLRTWLLDVLSADAGFSSQQHRPRRGGTRDSAFRLHMDVARQATSTPNGRETASAVWDQTIKELDKGLCDGPFEFEDMVAMYGPEGFRSIRRFGILQNEAIRVCDNARESQCRTRGRRSETSSGPSRPTLRRGRPPASPGTKDPAFAAGPWSMVRPISTMPIGVC